jgi:predicted patatin/cPLA2 family phospholipase
VQLHLGGMTPMAGPFWSEDHPVLAELRKRRRTSSTPRERVASEDGVKIGLAVEGGGMRAVISAAMLTALEDLGLGHAFDALYGSSAGALNAAFFLAGESWYPLSIYYDDLPTKRFIDFARPLAGQPILNLAYAFDDVLERRKPLDYERVLCSEVPLCVAITAVAKQATVLVSDFYDRDDLKAALRASSWLPGAVHGTADFRGERAIDGAVLTAHPWALASMDDCTHILSLSTHPVFAPRRYNSVVLRYAMRYLDRIEPGLGEGYAQSLRDNQRQLDYLARSMTDPVPDPFVLDLGPLPGAPTIKRHEMDRGVILDAARYGYELMLSAIEGGPPPLTRNSGLRVVPRLTVAEAAPRRSGDASGWLPTARVTGTGDRSTGAP